MTATYAIELEKDPRPEDVKAIHEGLRVYNLQYAPPYGFQAVSIFMRDSERRVVGGLLGDTHWSWLHVDILWVDASARQQGYGRQMLALAEQEALRRGCRHAHLDTLSFQALPFYEKLGYTVWGVLEDQPPGHKRYFLQKALVE